MTSLTFGHDVTHSLSIMTSLTFGHDVTHSLSIMTSLTFGQARQTNITSGCDVLDPLDPWSPCAVTISHAIEIRHPGLGQAKVKGRPWPGDLQGDFIW